MKKFIFLTTLNLFYSLSFGQWSIIGGGLNPNVVYPLLSIRSDSIGNIYAAGSYTNSTFQSYVSKWNGNTWQVLGNINTASNFNTLNSITIDKSGNIYVANSMFNGPKVAKYDNNTWTILGGNSLNFNQNINALCSDKNGNVYAGGAFTNSNGNNYVAKWNNSTWIELSGLNGWVNGPSIQCNLNDLCSDSHNNIYAVGDFTNSAGMYYVAKWNGFNWAELIGTNTLNSSRSIAKIVCDKDNNIFAVNCYNSTKDYYFISKWDGTAWQEIGDISSYTKNNGLSSFCFDSKGNLYTANYSKTNGGGSFFVLQWNGNEWKMLSGINACKQYTGHVNISSLCTDNEDNLYATGGLRNSDCDIVVMKYSKPYLLNVKESENLILLNFYPNPTSTKLHFNLGNTTNQKFNLNLTSGLGQTIITKLDADLNEGLDISSLSNGIYFLKIQNQFAQKTFKVVKE